MTGLLPCPFCGESEYLEENFLYDEYSQIICNARKGGCGGSSGGYPSEDETNEKWNARPAIKALQQQLSEAEAARDEIANDAKDAITTLEARVAEIQECLEFIANNCMWSKELGRFQFDCGHNELDKIRRLSTPLPPPSPRRLRNERD